MAQNSNVPRSQEDYITQVSEEIEGRVTKKLSQEFSRTENRILGALARLDDFLMSPLLQGHSGTTRETSRNVFSIDQGTNEDDSQSNPHPEVGLLISDRKDRHDMATGVQRECTEAHDISPIRKPFFRRRKTKDVGIFFVLKRKLSYSEIFAAKKSVKLVPKSNLIQFKETFSSIISKCVYGRHHCPTS